MNSWCRKNVLIKLKTFVVGQESRTRITDQLDALPPHSFITMTTITNNERQQTQSSHFINNIEQLSELTDLTEDNCQSISFCMMTTTALVPCQSTILTALVSRQPSN